MNKAMLLGRLTAKPEIKDVGNSKVCNFTVVTNKRWNDKDGNPQEKAEFHNVVAWGHKGEIIQKHFDKGQMISVEGELETRNWEKDGNKFYRTEIKLLNFEFGGDAPRATSSEAPAQPAAPAPQDDDLPF